MPADDVERLRAELRRLRAAVPGGARQVSRDQALPGGLVTVLPDGRRSYLGGGFFYGARISEFVAAAHNALPVLFAEIDRLRGRAGVPVLGDVIEDRVVWRSTRAA